MTMFTVNSDAEYNKHYLRSKHITESVHNVHQKPGSAFGSGACVTPLGIQMRYIDTIVYGRDVIQHLHIPQPDSYSRHCASATADTVHQQQQTLCISNSRHCAPATADTVHQQQQTLCISNSRHCASATADTVHQQQQTLCISNSRHCAPRTADRCVLNCGVTV